MTVILTEVESKTLVTKWVEEYSDGLFTWALHKTSNKEIAEDLVQETFAAAFQALDKFEGKSSYRTWLYGILNHKILDHYRSQYRQSNGVKKTDRTESQDIRNSIFEQDGHWKSDFVPQDWQNSEDHILDNPEFNARLAQCMDELPQNWRASMQLKYLEEKNGETICQELNITSTNFWQMLHRSKLQLRRCLEMNWFAKI